MTKEAGVRAAVEAIMRSSTMSVVYVTGGASLAIPWLLCVPGISKTILECRVPYSETSFLDTVGRKHASTVTSFSSAAAARTLAQAAYRRAVRLAPVGTRVCGVAAACALITSRPTRGEHRAFVATHCTDRTVEYELTLHKDARDRQAEDVLTSRLVLQAMLDDSGQGPSRSTIPTGHKTPVLPAEVKLSISLQSDMSLLRDALQQGDILRGPFVNEHIDTIKAVADGNIGFAERSGGQWSRGVTKGKLVFPGSFNPLHDGHRTMMRVAQAKYPDLAPAFEISVTNPDKPSLSEEEIRRRIEQFDDTEGVIITRAPLFSEKAAVLGGVKFVIGVDTAIRIVNPKYYEPGGVAVALAELRMRGCSFLVAGRLEQRKDTVKSTTFLTLTKVSIPTGFEDMFEEIPEDVFRVDLSSTEIRRRLAKDDSW